MQFVRISFTAIGSVLGSQSQIMVDKEGVLEISVQWGLPNGNQATIFSRDSNTTKEIWMNLSEPEVNSSVLCFVLLVCLMYVLLYFAVFYFVCEHTQKKETRGKRKPCQKINFLTQTHKYVSQSHKMSLFCPSHISMQKLLVFNILFITIIIIISFNPHRTIFKEVLLLLLLNR